MITKQHLIEQFRDEGHTLAQATAIVERVFYVLTAYLLTGQEVRIHGFGTFSTSDRKATTGRNPRTGEPIDIAARKAIRFKASAKLAGAVQPR